MFYCSLEFLQIKRKPLYIEMKGNVDCPKIPYKWEKCKVLFCMCDQNIKCLFLHQYYDIHICMHMNKKQAYYY